MILNHKYCALVCCVGMAMGSIQPASAQSFAPTRVLSVKVSHNAVRNNEKGMVVEIRAKLEGTGPFDGWTAKAAILDKKDGQILSLHAKKVIADNPQLFPTGKVHDYFDDFMRPKTKSFSFPGVKLPAYSILQGPLSDFYGSFSDSRPIFFLTNGNTSTVELFFPLSQFPFREKGVYDLTLRAQIFENNDTFGPVISSQSDPISFVFEVK